MHNNTWLIAILLCCTPVLICADVIHVPTGQPTIQAGIDAASNGDTVLLADGTYTGPGNRDIDFQGKTITIRSQNGRDFCTIDCEADGDNPHRAFLLNSGEGPETVIEGLTFANGFAPELGGNYYYGGAIFCDGTSPTIRDNFFIGNIAWENGGAISSWGGSPVITGNLFIQNAAEGGGALYVQSGDVLVANNTFIQNRAFLHGGGAVACSGQFTTVLVINNLFVDNLDEYGYPDLGGGALAAWTFSDVTVTNCTFLDNLSAGSGHAVFLSPYATLHVTDCILWGNPNQVGYDYYAGDLPLVDYSIVQGGWTYNGTGNLNQDPLLVTGPGGDHYLSHAAAGQPATSPARNSGSGSADSVCWTLDGQAHCLDQYTTRTDEIRDAGTVDMGYHYPARSSVAAALSCLPASGTLPFGCQMVVVLDNRYPETTRRLAVRINVELAGGQNSSSWRAGFTNIAGGGSYSASWVQNLPALPSLLGHSHFTLVAEDVTPAPWNQPPYLSSGDTGSATCQVNGIAP